MIYLCGITDESNYDNIKALTDPIYEHVDGLIFTYDSKFDADRLDRYDLPCYQLLLERCGKGDILTRPWTNDFDLQMNTYLREGPLKEGDWFIIRDSMERFDTDFAKDIKSFIMAHEAAGVHSIYNYGKHFAFRWNDSMLFQGNPHPGLLGARGKAVDLKDRYDEDKHEHTWRVRDGEPGGRPFDNKINHEAKYSWCYGRSNHLLLGLENNHDAFQRAEIIRKNIRMEAFYKGFDYTIEGLKGFIEYLVSNKQNEILKTWINSHRVWKNFYRYHFEKTDFYEIEETENEWTL